MKSEAETLLIVGASTRAAADSAVRAGYRPVCVDQFADHDLCEIAEADQARSSGDRARLIQRIREDVPAMYVGAVENDVATLTALENRDGPLWGNGRRVAEAVRDPLQLQKQLERAGFDALLVRAGDVESARAAPDMRWMLKPLRSGGGLGIREFDDGEYVVPAGMYLQEYVQGEEFSAVFCSQQNATEGLPYVQLVGCTRPIQGRECSMAHPFLYRGSYGSVLLTLKLIARLKRLGEFLAKSFGLVGVWGIDCVVRGEQLFVLEVNPRYTASCEVLERANEISLVGLHIACFGTATAKSDLGPPQRVITKLIVYAERRMQVPVDWDWDAQRIRIAERIQQECEEVCSVQLADLPQAGSAIEFGDPVLTLLGRVEGSGRLEREPGGINERLLTAIQKELAACWCME